MALGKKRKASDKPLTPDEALARLEQFCAFQERTPREVRRKLAELGQQGETAEQIYQVLLEDRYFDEARFADAFVRGKFNGSRWGRIRIRQELLQRGLSAPVIETALQSIEEEHYLETLKKLLAQKQQELQQRGDPRAAEKAAAALIRMGYEMELVFLY